MSIGGLDIGSTGAKITVLDQDGRQLHSGHREYQVDRNVGAHEINATNIWEAVKILLREAAGAIADLSALGITSFGESFVLLNSRGEVLLPTMMYTDPRGEHEAAILRESLGDDFICTTAGTKAHAMYSLPKLMWVKAHRPEVFAETQYVCLLGDYIVFKLTGKRLIDYSLAARTMGFDIRAKKWSREIFEAAGIKPSFFPEPVATGTDAGTILPEIAAELNIPKNLRVVICCHDQVAAAVGSDVTRPGIATDGGGTVQCMTPVFSPIPEGSVLQDNHFSIVPFLFDHTYCCYAFSFTGGSLVKWFLDGFAEQYHTEAIRKGITVYQLMEGQMKNVPTGILTLPHFAGAATPYMDTNSKGAFVGLDLVHTPVDLLKAIMEGIAYEMRLNMECLAEGGIKINSLNATGGCAKSRVWLQIKADILGVDISRMSTDEAGTIGGIMLTGLATGVYTNLEEAAKALVRTVETYHPQKEMQEQYEKHYQRYSGLYKAIRPLLDMPKM